jgi:hypothetical protein
MPVDSTQAACQAGREFLQVLAPGFACNNAEEGAEGAREGAKLGRILVAKDGHTHDRICTSHTHVNHNITVPFLYLAYFDYIYVALWVCLDAPTDCFSLVLSLQPLGFCPDHNIRYKRGVAESLLNSHY